jgi:dienelactone hydrolase
MESDPSARLELLGASWSPETRALHAWLDAQGIDHAVLEVETCASETELERAAGTRALPVLRFPEGCLIGAFPSARSLRARIERGRGRPLAGDLHFPPGMERPRGIVVLVHGFKGFKDWGFFPEIAARLARTGIAALRFNMSGCGILGDAGQFDDPEGFEHNTLGQERADLEAACRFARGVAARLFPGGEVPLGLLGHSRGGGMALLQAAGAPETRALVTWAAIASASRFGPEAEEAWRRGGSVPVVNARTGQTFHLRPDFYRELTEQAPRFDFLAHAGAVRCPWLLLHGAADETVPVAEGEQLYHAAGGEAAGGRARFQEIPGAGHTFGATHPLAHVTPDLEIAIAHTLGWFEKHLRPGGSP